MPLLDYEFGKENTEETKGNTLHDKCREYSKDVLKKVELDCGHVICKNSLINYVLELSLNKKSHDYCYQCPVCNISAKLKTFQLDCGCLIKGLKAISSSDELLYKTCKKDHTLTIIDSGIVNNYKSFEHTSLMTNEYQDRDPAIIRSFHTALRFGETEKVLWVLEHTTILRKLKKKKLIKAPKGNATLKEFKLSYRNTRGESAQMIGKLLKANAALKKLGICFLSDEYEGIETLYEALKYNETLTELSTNGSYILNPEQGEMNVMCEMLKVNRTLTNLRLFGDSSRDQNTQKMSEVLKANTVLKHLRFILNPSGHEIFRYNKTLTKVFIDCNAIEEEGGKVLGDALKANRIFKKFGMSGLYGNFSFKEIAAICNSLRLNKTLEKLRVIYFNAEDGSAKELTEIVEVLAFSKTLTKLAIQLAEVGYEGAKALSEALKTNRTLTYLNISGNNFTLEDVGVISEMLKVNKVLTSLNIENNSIDDKGAIIIGEL